MVTAVFHPVIDRRDELIAAMRAGIAATHEEPGCLVYAIHDAEDGTVTMIEKWASRADLDAHAHGAAIATLQADIAGLVTQPAVVTIMVPIPLGQVSRGALPHLDEPSIAPE